MMCTRHLVNDWTKAWCMKLPGRGVAFYHSSTFGYLWVTSRQHSILAGIVSGCSFDQFHHAVSHQIYDKRHEVKERESRSNKELLFAHALDW